ncbi:deoxyuridine 5'-triphosphate nucleotidohydrolase, mitochondrial isoform X2 [Saimiri boliviensis]|uniref:deoxyuridine 5'-triphosphate nucleotidohydrolase, mitochondrial isoform X2 n=1 Tax=Saimiri boliviensis TaxID=27679 RepID=UPI003D77CD66
MKTRANRNGAKRRRQREAAARPRMPRTPSSCSPGSCARPGRRLPTPLGGERFRGHVPGTRGSSGGKPGARPEVPRSQPAQTSGEMTPLCPRPALCHHFLPSLLRSAMQSARGARQRAEAGGLSGPGPPLGRAAQHGTPQPLSSAGRLSRGCRGAKTPVSPSKRARPAEEGGMQLRFARLSEHATAPTRGSARAAGYDLYSAYDYTIPPMEKALVKTDIQIALPSGCYGRVAGVIDEDYRGNVGVVLFNFGKEKFEVKKGDRIAQLICERIFYPEIEEVQALDDTERGSGGFGSTGKN